MKNFKDFILRKFRIPNILASVALTFAIIGANTACCCIFHQPKKPDMKKLRKF
ncbi:MAG: cyclic lactone autoinducer peptide [Anaerocolumna sp.]